MIPERELAASYVLAMQIRVNTGEAVAGEAAERVLFAFRQAVVLGDSVNVAARLEQAAAPGDVLIGEATFKLVRDAVTAIILIRVKKGKKEARWSSTRLLEASHPRPHVRGGPGRARGP